ncbi:MAG: toll/interleukin-1 receptor domain-containing protein [Coriobacteriales bacterium]|jgi:WD40 repeat protein|nr:toll/interleukin-1 receptor domain-containing protein [Coriobacteriales bacterium]
MSEPNTDEPNTDRSNKGEPNKGEQGFAYLAFISYSRKDEAFASWLQKRLESYRLPTATLKETPGLPKRVRPVFRDKTDLSSGSLGGSLNEALLQSNKLIVVCSPNAAQSEWVDHEISAFIETGRHEHIIPVIVDGMPNSTDVAQECFPPSLRKGTEGELLGIDVPSYGKQGTFIRVIAAMLGIRYDSLHRRHVRAKRKRMLSIAAIFLAVVLAVVGIALWIQSQARIPSLSSHLAAQAIVLANRDPETAAYFALASDALNSNDESREAMMVVAQNNRYAVASSVVSSSPIRQIASNGQFVLALGAGSDIAVLNYPDLKALSTLSLEAADATVAWRGTSGEFVAVDNNQLKFFTTGDGQTPLLTQSIDMGFDRTRAVFGPYVDTAGGVLVLSESMQGLYWSPKTEEALFFDLLEDETTRASYGDSTIRAASGFCENTLVDSQGLDREYQPTNGATRDIFCIATSKDYVLRLHLDEKLPSDGDAEATAPATTAPTTPAATPTTPATTQKVWVEQVLRNNHGSYISALGWLGRDLLVGTDVGLSSWENVGNSARESAFPLGGVTESILGIAEYHGSSDTAPLAILTEGGVRLVSNDGTVTLNGVTAASSATSPVTSVTTVPDGTWLAGRSNGAVMHLDPGARPLSTTALDTEASAQGIATDGSVLVSRGLQQRAWGISRYSLGVDETSDVDGYLLKRVTDYNIPDKVLGDGIFLNSIAGDDQVVVACGKRQPLSGKGVVLAWTAPGDEPLVLDFPSEFDYAEEDGFDMVTSVIYAPDSRTVAACNVQQGAVAVWSVDSGELLHTVQLASGLTGVFPDGANRMSASADGEWLAVTIQSETTIIRTETGEIADSFTLSPSAYAILSPDGSRLVLVDLNRISIINRQGQEEGLLMSPSEDSLVAVAWSPDASTLAVADGKSHEILFFDATSFKQIGLPWINPSGFIPADVQWTPSGAQLMVSNSSWNGSFYDSRGIDIIEPFASTWMSQLRALASAGVSDEVWQDVGGQGIAQPSIEGL